MERLTALGARMGVWRFYFSGRTELQAKNDGQLPFWKHLAEAVPPTG